MSPWAHSALGGPDQAAPQPPAGPRPCWVTRCTPLPRRSSPRAQTAWEGCASPTHRHQPLQPSTELADRVHEHIGRSPYAWVWACANLWGMERHVERSHVLSTMIAAAWGAIATCLLVFVLGTHTHRNYYRSCAPTRVDTRLTGRASLLRDAAAPKMHMNTSAMQQAHQHSTLPIHRLPAPRQDSATLKKTRSCSHQQNRRPCRAAEPEGVGRRAGGGGDEVAPSGRRRAARRPGQIASDGICVDV